ncbi:MAG: DeoR/GlpR transcriptional regulator, partial [Actinobacteria bacterium]|nr:DeoR/GlpR transcriptional regulator [Actinomycetota bacterium]
GIMISSSLKNSFESSFYERMQKNYSKKLEIAGKAMAYIEGKQTVFLDSSSTVFVLSQEIFKKFSNDKNFITNSPAIIVEAMNYPGVHIISTGGELRQEFNIFGGSWVTEFLEKINIDCAFVSAAGISPEGKITTNNKDLASILSLIFKKAKEVNLIADSSKFFLEGMLNIASLSDCTRLITDSEIKKSALKQIRRVSDVRVIF